MNEIPIDAKVEILLAEGNQSDSAAVLDTLKKISICNNVHVLSRGTQVLDFLFRTGTCANRPATKARIIVLLSLNLADAHGLDILRQIKNDERTRSHPVIILASSQEERVVMQSYSLGANGCIVKPLDLTKFAEAISDLRLGWLLLSQEEVKLHATAE